MEKLMRIPVLILTLFLTSCEYFGFDGYINQLEEIGINHELADAVSLGQHLTSRPREFNGKVYVLGTRGVYVLRASKLSNYQYYPYSQDLGYERDFWDDRLPPINCYRDPVSGRVVINALHEDWDRGLRYGDTLTLDEDTQQAIYTPISPDWIPDEPPVLLLRDSSDQTRYAVTDIFNDWDFQDMIGLWSDPFTNLSTQYTPVSQYILNTSFRISPDGYTVYFVSQPGIVSSMESSTVLTIYGLTAATWNTMPIVATLALQEQVMHSREKNSGGEFISGNLNVSVNNRYMLIWGDDLEDEETMLVYDYLTGERKLKTDIPGNETFPELAESGMDIFVTSIRGGVARYAYD